MPNAPDDLMEKVGKGIAKSGFPLEMEIGNVLRSANWYTEHSPHYFDIDELQYREYDIKASRSGNIFDTQLYIECKRSSDKQWVFYVPERYEAIYVQDLRFFPIKKGIQFRSDLARLSETIFSGLTAYCEPSGLAINDSIFMGNKNVERGNKSDDIRDAIKTSIKALIGDNVGNHIIYPGVPRPRLRPIMCFAVVVFDGFMFSYVQQGTSYRLEDRAYVKYRASQLLNLLNFPADIRRNPYIDLFTQYENNMMDRSALVEIVHKEYFSQYVKRLNESIDKLNSMPAADFRKATSRWFDV